jgi:RNA polymerase sigma-70 factor, ECF subfamily
MYAKVLTPAFGPRPLDSGCSDAELVRSLAAAAQSGRDRGHAGIILYDRYAGSVERILLGVLGPDQELQDVLQETFLQAYRRIHTLDDAECLGAWLRSIAVFCARCLIRKRSRRRWLAYFDAVPEVGAPPPDREIAEASRATFAVLSGLPEVERVVFSLRYMNELPIGEIALATDLSLSTVKRKLASAEQRFCARAKNFPALHPWIERSRWATT